MPRKIRELIRDLERAGFSFEPGKGSHRKFRHPLTTGVVVVAGQLGGDARDYQERAVRDALAALEQQRRKTQ